MRAPRLLAAAGTAVALAACQSLSPPSAPDAPERGTVASSPTPKRVPLRTTRTALPELEAVQVRTAGDVLDRLTARLDAPACVRGSHNNLWRERYAAQPDRFAARVKRILPLLDYVMDEVEAADLPGEFALIPVVESWYRPDAHGAGGSGAPAGLWQMIPSTARHHGVTITPGYDGRYSPVESTQAAIAYLDSLHTEFGDWRATVMAYNAGEGRMRRALAKDARIHGERRRPGGLASHTYTYVDKLRALSCLIAQPEKQGVAFERDAVIEPLAEVTLAPGTQDLAAVAAALELESTALAALNPAYAGGRIGVSAPHVLLVPARTRLRWNGLASLPSASPPAAEAGEYIVRSGDTLSEIAQRHGLDLSQLLRWNQLSRSAVLQPGQSIKLTQ
ncbi:transglycosylase SLT domain-containing protein [Coralloluteibacterium stylophorae]|uniref:Transglycosylase SLT domain-containing protein n=1 Tax=Coralloluteibacterium stylophorae TaxID=1776034 RepID=A0A8J7VRM6_9GAMM|nr:transglycosylase SLT domain-containing protein [Coralloluteibacterium stylophorae]MBS7457661.1 transglycosylase SLT domain-containing protein [Coralloluteibacterium stylophorae]